MLGYVVLQYIKLSLYMVDDWMALSLFGKDTGLSDASIKQYTSKVSSLMGLCGWSVDYIVEHPDEVVKCIEGHYSELQTQKAYIAAVRSVIKHCRDGGRGMDKKILDKWYEHGKRVNDLITARYEEGMATDKQKESFVKWEDVVGAYKKLGRKEWGSKRHLLLAMYVLEEPKRQDYGMVRIFKGWGAVGKDKDRGNYLVIECGGGGSGSGSVGDGGVKMTLVLNEYKTAKVYDKMERVLRKELIKVIRDSLKKEPREYLFVDRTGKPYVNDNSFIKFSNRVLEEVFDGKPVTVSTLRHSFIEYMYRMGTTHKQRVEMSKSMGHSITMQSQYAFEIGDGVKCRVVCGTTKKNV